MKSKLLFFGVFVFVLVLSRVWAVGAQGPQPPQPGSVDLIPESFNREELKGNQPFSFSKDAVGIQTTGLTPSSNFLIGQPGLSFRYVQTFGKTEQPYLTDETHLYAPAGLFVDASDQLYIAEALGDRMLRFNDSFVNNLILGHAGLSWHHGDYLSDPKDVAVDTDGNIWVVFNPTVKKFDPSGNPLMTIPQDNPWEGGADNYHFIDPWGIAFDSSGRLFVSDAGNHRIQIYDVSGPAPTHILTIGTTGQPQWDNSGFNTPRHIAFDHNGRLYVVDEGNHRIQRCTVNSGSPETWTCETFFGQTGVKGSDLSHLSYPRGIAISGNNIFIADSDNYRVLKCDADTKSCTTFAGQTGERGWDNNHFWWPEDVAVDSFGRVYVSDWDNHRVQVFNNSGYLDTIGVTRVPYITDNSYYNKPWGIAIAPDGSIYVTENRGYRLIKLSAAGNPVWAVGEAGVYGSDNTHFGDWWAGLEGKPAVDKNGRVFVPDTGNNRIQIFNAGGNYIATFGSYGNGNDQFECPTGVAISPVNGDIFVVDHCNQRIQVYNSALGYKATLGTLDEIGSDNAHFNWPYDVAIDANGNIYVADTDNHRIQKCNLTSNSYTCTTFVGEVGIVDELFGHLNPISVAVDGAGRVYVTDDWNSRIQVFDHTGAYLTTIGGSWSNRTGGLRAPRGVVVDNVGNVYVADMDNHRIQKFAPGVPGWRQVNINGFFVPSTVSVTTLASFSGHLYAGTFDLGGYGAELWRMDAAGTWTPVTINGFDNPANMGIYHLLEFNGYLYAGTWSYESNGGEVWRSSDGQNWTQVVASDFGNPTNAEVFRLSVFSNQIYAGTRSYTDEHGAEIWRSSTGDAGSWQKVVTNGFDNPNNKGILTMEEFNGALYAGTFSDGPDDGADLWRYDGNNWSAVTNDGFGNTDTYAISALAVFNDYLYAGTGRYDPSGGQIWRCSKASGCDESSDWEVVIEDGFGNPDNIRINALLTWDAYLYATTFNFNTGMEVWRTVDGTHWEQVGFAGLGDSNNRGSYWDNGMTVFNDNLYLGTFNVANGGEVWQLLRQIYLPLVSRNQ